MTDLKGLVTIPRIIGIALLIIAALTYPTQGAVHAGLLGIAGLVLLLTPKHASAKHWQHFLDSLRHGKESALVMLFDVIFLALLAVLTLILANALRSPIAQLNSIKLGSDITIGNIAAYNVVLKSIFTTSIAAVIIFWLAVVAAYTLSRGLIWLTLLEKPVQRPFFIRLGLMNVLWCTVWLLITLFFMGTLPGLPGARAFFVLLALYAHLTTILHYSYAKTRSSGKAFKDAFGYGLGALGQFAVPYCYVFIVYVILSQVLRFAQNTSAGLAVTFIVFLVFLAWYRIFMRSVLRQLI